MKYIHIEISRYSKSANKIKTGASLLLISKEHVTYYKAHYSQRNTQVLIKIPFN